MAVLIKGSKTGYLIRLTRETAVETGETVTAATMAWLASMPKDAMRDGGRRGPPFRQGSPHVQPNMGDWIVHALAKPVNAPLHDKGGDFGRAGIASAVITGAPRP